MKTTTKLLALFFLVTCFVKTSSAQTDTSFFPSFQPYVGNPIIHYGDGFADASWNDPCVLKVGSQYIMYISAATGIKGSTTVKVYRMLSSDGYSWSLYPSTPVVQAVSGTYYEGGTETPTVVIKDGTYHMYLTTYPSNVATNFTLGHATSADGISWTMDAAPILAPDGSPTWHGIIVGDPGALVYHDSIFVYFSGAGTVGATTVQCIGVIKSPDGSTFGAPEQVVTLPEDVYPSAAGYFGLSTPSALAINDSIYLFSDVAQMVGGNWTQVALHQFKTDGSNGVWYHADSAIHTMQDFPWTNGDYLSEIRSITPLMDDGGRLRIWYAGNHIADISGTDTTYNVTIDGSGIHVDPNFWGIGTSEYVFPTSTGITDVQVRNNALRIYPNPTKANIFIAADKSMTAKNYCLRNAQGQHVLSGTYTSSGINLEALAPGIYFLELEHAYYKVLKQD